MPVVVNPDKVDAHRSLICLLKWLAMNFFQKLILVVVCLSFSQSLCAITVGQWAKLLDDPKKEKEARAIFVGHVLGSTAVFIGVLNSFKQPERVKADIMTAPTQEVYFERLWYNAMAYVHAESSGWCLSQTYSISQMFELFTGFAKLEHLKNLSLSDGIKQFAFEYTEDKTCDSYVDDFIN